MPDKILALLSAPGWVYALIMPCGMLVIMLGWLSLMLGRQKLVSFAVRGLGISIQVRALSYPAIDERAYSDERKNRKD